MHAAAARLNLHLARDALSARLVAGGTTDDGADANLVAIPRFNVDAAVLSGIDVQRSGRQRRVTHLAVLVIVVITIVGVAARIRVAADLHVGVAVDRRFSTYAR